jgi:hypothetical protein
VTTSSKGVDPRKAEQKPAKLLKDNSTPSSSTGEPATEGSVNPQRSTTESASKKAHASTDPVQPVRGSNRSSPQAAAQLPPGAALPAQVGQPPQETERTPAAADATATTANRGEKLTNKTDAAPPDGNPEEIIEHDAMTSFSEISTKALPEEFQDEDSDSSEDFEEVVTATQDGSAGLASGVLGGIATAFGMRPATAREARLEKSNHRLKEENKLLRTEYFRLERTAHKFHHDACRFHHENQRFKETIDAMSLEVKGLTRRYEEAKALSETRGKELHGAQVFLTKADALSMSELTQKVDGLNDEIYQAAASLGEAIVQKKIETSEQPHYSPEEGAITKALLGVPLYKLLRSRARNTEEGINPLLVQIALQAFFAVFCINRIRSWTPANVHFNAALQDLYSKIWFSSECYYECILLPNSRLAR